MAEAEPPLRVPLTVIDRRGHRGGDVEAESHKVQAPPTARVAEVVRRLRQRVPALAGIRCLLDENGMAPIDPGCTLAEALRSGQLRNSDTGGMARVSCVGCWEEPIFVHVPKTGGTTMIAALRQQAWQPSANDFHYRHIVYETATPTCADLFAPDTRALYTGHTVLTILREPLARILSEYAFLRDRPHFVSRLHPPPCCLLDYIRHPQTANGMLRFLLGRPMFDLGLPGEELGELELRQALGVMGLLDDDTASAGSNPGGGCGVSAEPEPEPEQMVANDVPKGARWVVGLLERYEETVALFSRAAPTIGLPNTVQKKRVTLYKPPFETAAARVPGGEVALRREFEAANWLDMRLYAAATRRFERHMQKQAPSAAAVMKFGGSNAGGQVMTTVGDRYDYLLKYAKRSSIATPFAPDDGQELAGVEEAVAAADKAAHAALNRQPSLGAGYVHQLECM